MSPIIFIAAVLAFDATTCAYLPSLDAMKLSHSRNAIMELAKRRVPSPQPISLHGIRYEATEGMAHGFDHNSGIIAAIDEETGKTLWTLMVYPVKFDQNEEMDVQEIFITDLSLGDNEKSLIVKAENGKNFIVSLEDRSVSTMK